MAEEGGVVLAGSLAGEEGFTPEIGRTICARVAAGESLRRLCREPEMPHRTTVRRWANREPQFAEDLREAQREARFEQRRLDRELAAAKRARPRPEKGGSDSSYTPAVGEAICLRLANGESLIAIVRDADMPCYGTVYGWLKRHPEFEAAYVQARMIQADYFLDEAREVALGSTHETVWSDRLAFDTIRWMTARMAPKKYCERLVLDAEISARKAEAAGLGQRRLTVQVVDFSRGPNGEVLVAPPRNAEEEAGWERAYGKPYDGPR
ncbi:hypothetical protein [Phenylobacterium sp.]|uniref:terminase small subunit-like protein n=1 Tax=Phenylobacterium sp. TaxID=1871053 RepID=UPI0035646240